VYAAAAAAATAADSSSAESEWVAKNKLKTLLSSLSQNHTIVDKRAADIYTVRGDKGSAIRSKKKKIASEQNN